MIDDLLARVRALPGVVVAGAGGGLPPASSPMAFSIRVMIGAVDRMQTFDLMPVTEGYLDALGATITDGPSDVGSVAGAGAESDPVPHER